MNRPSLRQVLFALLTPLLEKNVIKTLSLEVPVVFSISRVIVLALPMLGALERVRPTEVVELAKTLVSRFGEGGIRGLRSVYAEREPSKFDDHRDD